MRRVVSGLLLPLWFVVACQRAPLPPPAGPAIPASLPTYAESAWPTLHRDSRNSDYAPIPVTPPMRVAWESLDGAAIWVGPTIGPEGNLYISSGQGEGHSNLRALDADGNLIWEAAPQTSLADLDHGAVINAAIVDAAGNVYQADSDQLWSFSASGDVRWVASLRAHGALGQFVTPVFTREGYVAGITTDGKLLAFDRATGRRVWPVFELPAGPGPPALDPPEGFNRGGMLAEGFHQTMWNIVMGREVAVANTPAVHPVSGRIYITGAGASPEEGALYGIDTSEDAVRLAFATPIGAGSGTSPALSVDGRLVYAADGAGHLVAVDADSGAVIWRADGVQGAASPSVGPDGTVYSFSGPTIVARNGASGRIAWSRDYHDLAAARLPPAPFGRLRADIDSLLTLTEGPSHPILWACINLGVELPGPEPFALPLRIVVAAIDARNGDVLATTPIRDTSSAVIVPGPGGRLYVSLAGVTTSSIYYAQSERLPEALRPDAPPKAGLVALEPAE